MDIFYCPKCGIPREFRYTDYYDFDHFVCPQCGDDLMFPADAYDDFEDEDMELDDEQ